MYEWMVLTFPLFSSKEDYKQWFKTEKERMLYRFFAASQNSELVYARRVRRMLSDVQPYQYIYIYGAGVVGQRVYHALEFLGVQINGFLVTDRGGNPDTLFGHPVLPVDEVEVNNGKFAIVAVSKKYRDEVIRKLESLGWEYSCIFTGSTAE